MNVEIVVARYNEDLKWLNTYPFNIFPITIYNKGVNTEFTIQSQHRIIQLDNVGRCDHTYLYHIVHNYNHLADITIFLPGSNDIDYKKKKSRNLIYEILKHKKAVFLSIESTDILKKFYNFKLDTWKCTHEKNDQLYSKTTNMNNSLELSPIRPFGRWYQYYFGNLKIKNSSFCGIFSISKINILQKPVHYYEIFLKQLETSANPEIAHYIERSWAAILHPFYKNNVVCIKYIL